MRRLVTLVAAALLAVCVISSSASAGLRVSRASGAKFPARAFLLTLSTSTRLAPSQVSVTENGTPVAGLSVVPASSVGQSHFGTVLLIDRSNSMAGAAIQSAILAARTFVHVRNPNQPVGIVFFSQGATIVAPLTSNTATLDQALASVPATHAGTHIFDAASVALQMIGRARLAAGSIVLLSDGQDTGSRISQAAFANDARTRGVAVYTVGVRDPSFTGSTLETLAAASNGLYTPLNVSALTPFYRTLGIALSNQYLIRYTSAAPLGETVPVAVNVKGVGSAATSYTTPTLTSGVNLTPAHINHSSFWASAAGSLVIIVACALLIGAAVLLALTKREGVRTRIGSFVSTLGSGNNAATKTLVQRALGDPGQRRVSSPWFVKLGEDLEIARIRVSPTRLVAITLMTTVLLGWVLLNATSSLLGALLALAFPVLVVFGIRYLAERQRRLFDEQLPDNLTVIASALRAGHTFAGALRLMLEDAPEPTRRELTRAMTDEALGVPLADSLNTVAERMRSLDFQQVTLVATLQRDTGGNTAEIIDVVTDTVRDRLDLRRLVRSLTSQGRLAGGILSVMPVAILIVVSLINPHYTHPLFHTFTGIVFLVLGAVLVLTGAAIIRRIVDIEI